MGKCLTAEQLNERWKQKQDPTLEKTIPEDPVLTCASPAMKGLTVWLRQQWSRNTTADGKSYYQQTASLQADHFFDSHNFNGNLLYYMSLPAGNFQGVYAWMDPLKEEDRYNALLERVRTCTRIRPLEE